MKPTRNKMKHLITDPTIWINEKNIKAYEINSFHRCLITTNHEEPIVVSKDTRRDVVIRCSDELINNKCYFDKIYSLINDDNIVRDLYDYLLSLKGLDNFDKIALPKTEYQENLSDLSISVIEQWIKYWTIENYYREERIIKLTSEDLYNEFILWRDKKKITYDITILKVTCRVYNSNIDGITKEKTRKCNLSIFNIDKLIKYFNIKDEKMDI